MTGRSHGTRAVVASLLCVQALAFTVAVCSVAGSGEASADARSANAAFDRIAGDAFASGAVPGFVVAIVRARRVVYAKAFGVADIERNVPVETGTRFAIGSLTKQFTAGAVLMLAQRGELALDDPLAKWLPSFPNARAITLRMLLNQTSGLHDYPNLAEHDWPLTGTIDLDRVLALLATDTPDFAPGAQWAYSNTNYALLAAVIARAGDLDEATFLQRSIFDPLRMTSSGYGYAAQRTGAVARPYAGRAPFASQAPISLDLYAGAGAMVASASDVAAWDIALLDDALLDEASRTAIWTPGKLASGASVPYAMGFVPGLLAGHREVWHNGFAPGAGGYCLNAIFPDDGLAVVVLSNGDLSFEPVAQTLVRRVLAVDDPQASVVTPPAPAAGEDPAVTERAKDWWHRLQSGTVDLALVTPQFAQRLTPEFLAQLSAALGAQPTPVSWIYRGASSAAAGITFYTYWIRIGDEPHLWTIGLTAEGKIAASQLK